MARNRKVFDEAMRAGANAAWDKNWDQAIEAYQLALAEFPHDVGALTRLGLAFCQELIEPAEILAGVLRRFFEVVPACCKIGGLQAAGRGDDGTRRTAPGGRPGVVACNPLGQAELLNRHATDLNVIVGLCVGVDAMFAKASRAPVTTLFVKDRSLANNPIGALYSEYYLRESLGPAGRHATVGHPLNGTRGRDRRSDIATAERQPRKERI